MPKLSLLLLVLWCTSAAALVRSPRRFNGLARYRSGALSWAAQRGASRPQVSLAAMKDGTDKGPAWRALETLGSAVVRNAGLFMSVTFLVVLATGHLLDLLFWGILLFPITTFTVSAINQALNSVTSDCPVCGASLKAQKNSVFRCGSCGNVLRAGQSRFEKLETRVGPETAFGSLFDVLLQSRFNDSPFSEPDAAPFGQSDSPFGGNQRPPVVEVETGPAPAAKKSRFEDQEGDIVDVEVKNR